METTTTTTETPSRGALGPHRMLYWLLMMVIMVIVSNNDKLQIVSASCARRLIQTMVWLTVCEFYQTLWPYLLRRLAHGVQVQAAAVAPPLLLAQPEQQQQQLLLAAARRSSLMAAPSESRLLECLARRASR